MKTSTLTFSLAFTSLFALSGYNCNDVLRDPGFDLWCGNQLCAWELESGQLEQAPTWHTSDTGVSMVGDDVAISQFVDRNDIRCLRFELIADIEENAEVTLELDLFNDGVVEHEQRIPTSNWQELSYMLQMPYQFEGILFRLRKRGGGRAVLAEIAAMSEGSCADAPQVASETGSLCFADDECMSETCAPSGIGNLGVCSVCAGDEACAPDEVCGLKEPDLPRLLPYRDCQPAAQKSLGQRCALDSECATGFCEESVCSACREDTDCPGEVNCRRSAHNPNLHWQMRPWQCLPTNGVGLAGDTCLAGSDCQSGQCQGSGDLRLCLSDSRVCSVDEDCPGSMLGLGGDNAICATVGTAHGVCQ